MHASMGTFWQSERSVRLLKSTVRNHLHWFALSGLSWSAPLNKAEIVAKNHTSVLKKGAIYQGWADERLSELQLQYQGLLGIAMWIIPLGIVTLQHGWTKQIIYSPLYHHRQEQKCQTPVKKKEALAEVLPSPRSRSLVQLTDHR